MCGRFILGDGSWAEYHEALSIIKPVPYAQTSYNIKPTQSVQIAYTNDSGIIADSARWWFVPSWHKGEVKDWKATTFNARLETAWEKNTYRVAWKNTRCIIPASGYYEWTGEKGKKLPWYISTDTNVPVFFFAGLYSTRPDGAKTCTILTRDAVPQIKSLHARMPVILRNDQLRAWMDHSASDNEVKDSYGIGWQFKFHRVNKFGMKDDGPELIDNCDLF